MTKKQLLQALSIVDDDTNISAVFNGRYANDYEAQIVGVKITFKENAVETILLINEVESSEISKAA